MESELEGSHSMLLFGSHETLLPHIRDKMRRYGEIRFCGNRCPRSICYSYPTRFLLYFFDFVTLVLVSL